MTTTYYVRLPKNKVDATVRATHLLNHMSAAMPGKWKYRVWKTTAKLKSYWAYTVAIGTIFIEYRIATKDFFIQIRETKSNMANSFASGYDADPIRGVKSVMAQMERHVLLLADTMNSNRRRLDYPQYTIKGYFDTKEKKK